MSENLWYTTPDGTLEIRFLSQDRLEETLEVVEASFLKHEGLCVFYGIPNDPIAIDELKKFCIEAAKDGLSLIAIDKTETEEGRVIGFQITKLQLNKPGPSFFDKYIAHSKSQNVKDFLVLLNDIDFKCNLFKRLNVDCLAEIMFMGVLPEYRHKHVGMLLGIATTEVTFLLFCGLNVKQSLDGSYIPLAPTPKAISCIYTTQHVKNLWSFLPEEGTIVPFVMPSKNLIRNGKNYADTLNSKDHENFGVVYFDFTSINEDYMNAYFASGIRLMPKEFYEIIRRKLTGQPKKSHL